MTQTETQKVMVVMPNMKNQLSLIMETSQTQARMLALLQLQFFHWTGIILVEVLQIADLKKKKRWLLEVLLELVLQQAEVMVW